MYFKIEGAIHTRVSDLSHTYYTCAALLHSGQHVSWQQNDGEINSGSLNACQVASEVMILDKWVDTAGKAHGNKGIEAAAKGNGDETQNPGKRRVEDAGVCNHLAAQSPSPCPLFPTWNIVHLYVPSHIILTKC